MASESWFSELWRRIAAVQELAAIRGEIEAMAGVVATATPAAQRLHFTRWMAQARGIQEAWRGERWARDGAYAIAQGLGRLARIGWPGSVPALAKGAVVRWFEAAIEAEVDVKGLAGGGGAGEARSSAASAADRRGPQRPRRRWRGSARARGTAQGTARGRGWRRRCGRRWRGSGGSSCRTARRRRSRRSSRCAWGWSAARRRSTPRRGGGGRWSRGSATGRMTSC